MTEQQIIRNILDWIETHYGELKRKLTRDKWVELQRLYSALLAAEASQWVDILQRNKDRLTEVQKKLGEAQAYIEDAHEGMQNAAEVIRLVASALDIGTKLVGAGAPPVGN